MASKGICDRVAIVGMGCTPFGEHWDKGADDLLVDSATAAFDSAGVAKDDVDAYWLGTMGSGISGLTLSRPLKLDYKPVTRLENMCATGSEAFRNACYAVASGAVDTAMAIGVEKLKDSGFSGLVVSRPPDDGSAAELSAPALFSLLAPAYSKKYGVDKDELKNVLTRIAWKNHKNGAVNPRAQFRREVPMETIAASPSAARRGRKPSPAPSTSTAICPSTPTAASRPSATPSAPAACACCSSAGCSSEARPRPSAPSNRSPPAGSWP